MTTPTTAADLRRVALEQFAASGYLATSIQQIADAAGVSKASVLYHYASKEALLEAVLAPALDEIERLIGGFESIRAGKAARRDFLDGFVGFLIEHRLAAAIFVNQSSALGELPIIQRANLLIEGISGHLERRTDSAEEKMRFGIALAGSAYLLAQAEHFSHGEALGLEELRPLLTRILVDLIEGS